MKPIVAFRLHSRCLLLCGLFISVIAGSIYQENMGGSGLSLPSNILIFFIWTVYGILLLSIPRLWRQSSPSVALPWLYGGALILLLRGLVGDSRSINDLIITLSTIAGMLISYRLLMQLVFTRQIKKTVLGIIALTALSQAVIGLVQFFHLPAALLWEFPVQQLRPYGIFQQVNVYASFLASGVAATLCLCLHSWQKRRLTIFFYFSLILMALMLFLSQSQTGWLGALLVIILLLLNRPAIDRKKLWLPLLCLSAGILLGIGIYQLTEMTFINHQSTSATRLILWKYCFELFLSRPWLGWGIGNFEPVFLEQFGGQTTGAGARTVGHPHNEIILWAVEAGSAGLAAALLWISAIVRLYLKGGKHQRMMLIVALPVLLHTLTEYPLYQSALHMILLIVVLRCAEPPVRSYRNSKSRKERILLATVLICFAALLAQTFFLQRQLTFIERSGRQAELVKRTVQETAYLNARYQYDYQMGQLLTFNRSGDPQLLMNFERWAGESVRIRPEATLYAIRIRIALIQGDEAKATALTRQAKWLFPGDSRWQ
ncbi:PglL family O-oligosaccharyltransferase [Tatumella saanichensis]|uniref:PglL family O-oligosaccharyltransferase n=1 Tax=Tatumella saanichensis TaxID=480813 RepID=UPI0004A4025E|nr:Wzy polymerase domain-containing protein [Tatumella saanichensis]